MHGGKLIQISKSFGKDPEEFVDFSANLHPNGLKEELGEEIRRKLRLMEHYPSSDITGIKSKLASGLGVLPEYLHIGNGAADLLYKLVLCFSRPIHALLISPSFSEYERAVKSVLGSKIRFVSLNERMELGREYMEALDEGIDLAIICNPNNPTGLLTDNTLLDEILDQCAEKNIILCLDECFLDFVKRGERYSYLSELGKYQNLVILRSFTKLFCIPGLRLGMLLTKNAYIMERLRELTPSWNISSLGMAALEYISDMDFTNFVDHAHLEVQREKLKKALKECGFTVFSSKANYLFFQTNDPDLDLYERLLEKGIIIRDCFDYRGLTNGFYRIAVKSETENERLMEALKEFNWENVMDIQVILK